MNQIDISAFVAKNQSSPGHIAGLNNFRFRELFCKEITLFGNGFGSSKKQQFYHDLSVLLGAGVDLSSAIGLTGENFKKNSDRVMMESIRDAVIDGKSFSDTLRDTGKFSIY